jgi:hypothetical protein
MTKTIKLSKADLIFLISSAVILSIAGVIVAWLLRDFLLQYSIFVLIYVALTVDASIPIKKKYV